MASVTAKTTLIEKIEALVSKSAEDHRILSVHYRKEATKLLKSSTTPAAYSFDEDEVTDVEGFAEFERLNELANKHKRSADRKASAIRADRRDSGFSRRDFEVAC